MCETCCYKAVLANPYLQSFRTPPKDRIGSAVPIGQISQRTLVRPRPHGRRQRQHCYHERSSVQRHRRCLDDSSVYMTVNCGCDHQLPQTLHYRRSVLQSQFKADLSHSEAGTRATATTHTGRWTRRQRLTAPGIGGSPPRSFKLSDEPTFPLAERMNSVFLAIMLCKE